MVKIIVKRFGIFFVIILFGSQLFLMLVRERPPDDNFSKQIWIDFELPTSNEEIWSSASITNQAVILNFWAPWCLPCRTEIPYLIELQTRYSSAFKIIGIAIDQLEAVRRFEDEVGLNYLSLVSDSKGMALLHHYESSGALPLTLIFDQSGILRHRVLGPIEAIKFEQALNELP